MIRKNILLATILIFMIGITACDNSTDPKDDGKEVQAEVEKEIQEMDQTMGQMAEGPMIWALLQFQSISENMLPFGVIPFTPEKLVNLSLYKNSPEQRFFEIQTDTTLIALFAMLELMQGTHTFSDTGWVRSEGPANTVTLVYDFVSLEDGQQRTAQIVISNYSLNNTSAALTLAIKIDNETAMTMQLSIEGTSFVLPGNSTMSKVNVSGSISNPAGIPVTYTASITNTTGNFVLQTAGVPVVTITATGTDLLSQDITSGDVGGQISSISITYKTSLQFVVTDLNAESGDVGDVLYKTVKVADIVAEDESLYIEFDKTGVKKDLAELMPNSFLMLASLGGLGS